jgi:hypothetical protein
MEETVKRGPGRPPKQLTDSQLLDQTWPAPEAKKVRFVQMHDAFTPLQMAPIMSLGIEGAKKVDLLEERTMGVYVETKGRSFLVPFGNISFLEYDLA